MSEKPDPIELIRAADPAARAELADHDSAEGRRLLAQILAQPRHPVPAPYRRWRRVVLLIAASSLLMAAAWVFLRPVTEPLGQACYAAPDLDADRVAVAFGTDLDPEACAPLWADRILSNPAIVAPGVVPEFRACVSPSGGLAVFPTADKQVCSRLGLSQPDPASIPEAERVRQLAETLADRFGSVACQSMDEAAAIVRQVLDEYAFTDWVVVTTTTTGDRRCASVALDVDSKQVALVPIP